jgi:hypothetical protein
MLPALLMAHRERAARAARPDRPNGAEMNVSGVPALAA